MLVSNAATGPVTISGRGSGYQRAPGGPGPGADPGHRVSDEWIRHRPTTVLPDTMVATGSALVLFQCAVDDGAEVEGRFALRASGPVHVEVVASQAAALDGVRHAARGDAPGTYRVAGDPPPFGRAAGVYAHDTWRGAFMVAVPPPVRRVGLLVNTATGSGHTQVQAFPALTHYDRSARESAGMHGNVYDLAFHLRSAGADGPPRRVRLLFCSYADPADPPSWDGVALVSGGVVALRHAGAERCTALGERTADAVAPVLVRLQAMVPGVASLPQALFLESR